jgi:transcriptional regulator with XRE-family HTH domain
MPPDANHNGKCLTGHALRNSHLRERSLARAETAPALARAIVHIRAGILGLTRLEFCRRSGLSRGTLRDLELGVHTPTRRVLQRFVAFCQQCQVEPAQLEEVRRLYAGPGDTLEQFIARLELRAGSPRELARRVGISPATLWAYRRGNFPIPLALLRQLCSAAGEDATPGEALWYTAERRRLLDRGYPAALAEFWSLCGRAGYAEKHLLELGLSTPTVRRLRYLELPPWQDVVRAADALCQTKEELLSLQRLWNQSLAERNGHSADGFGPRLQKLRKQRGITRRELADLFGIGGKKPARILKYIEEDGFYSAQAYPAGLTALLTDEPKERGRLLDLWQERRRQFHRRHRPEMRIDLRLARELYGFSLTDMQTILGYTSLEYQRIERGVVPLLGTARDRIVQALHQAGQRRIEALFQQKNRRDTEQTAWQRPSSLAALIKLLSRREGGLIPLMRHLKQAGLKGLWTGRLRQLARGTEIPPWQVVEAIGRVCGVGDLSEVREDWTARYRAELQVQGRSPLGVELRLLIFSVVSTLRAFSGRLHFNCSVLIRDLQRIDRDEPIRWFHVERILLAAGVVRDDERWREMHALWYTAADRRKSAATAGARRRPPELG